MDVIEMARRKLAAGKITQDEFDVIVGCDALIGFDKDGGLLNVDIAQRPRGA